MSTRLFPNLSAAARNIFAATTITLATGTAAFANDQNVGLDMFLAEPTSFVAISEGAPGSVTHASMVDDRLLVQFTIPTHSGDSFGEVVGKVDANGVFAGNGILIDQNGSGRAAAVSMTFNDDGTIIADVRGKQRESGFMPRDAFYGY